MFCGNCGQIVSDGFSTCPNCGMAIMAENNAESNKEGGEFVHNGERIISVLKNGRLDNVITGEGFKKEYAIITDKRIYYKYKTGIINIRREEEILDLRDVTGTRISSVNLLGTLIGGILLFIISLICGLLVRGVLYEYLICAFLLNPGIIMIIVYFVKLKKYLFINYAGGSIKFSVRGYSMKNIQQFQKDIYYAKELLD